MSNFLVFSNVRLGIDLLGAIAFFIVALLFSQAYVIKKDRFSLTRAIGFSLLALWQVFAALDTRSSSMLVVSFLVYTVGLALVLISYATEKLPEKPHWGAALLPTLNLVTYFHVIPTILLFLTTALFIKQYYKDINKLLKWLIIGFSLLSCASLIANFIIPDSFGGLWLLYYVIKLAAFVAVIIWVWKFLSFRIREEMLIVFVFNGLVMALLIITVFSTFFLKNIERETLSKLNGSSQLLSFYIDSLKNKALASSQIMASNQNFASAVASHDVNDLQRLSDSISENTGMNFVAVATKGGDIFFKNNFPLLGGENIIREPIAQDALEGRSGVTINDVLPEGLTIRAAAPVVANGKIVGVVETGYLLDQRFVDNVKKIVGFETSLIKDSKVRSSSILLAGTPLNIPQDNFVGALEIAHETTIAGFSTIVNDERDTVAHVAFSTTPGALLHSAQATNISTMLIITLVILGLILPLYRFTVYITR